MDWTHAQVKMKPISMLKNQQRAKEIQALFKPVVGRSLNMKRRLVHSVRHINSKKHSYKYVRCGYNQCTLLVNHNIVRKIKLAREDMIVIGRNTSAM